MTTAVIPATAQDAYEAMRRYFTRPGAVLAKTNRKTCMYRTEEGNKCAIGCLIPDDLYFSKWEDGYFDAPVEVLGEKIEGLGADELFVSSDAQGHRQR